MADPIFADREAEHSVMLGVLGNLEKDTGQKLAAGIDCKSLGAFPALKTPTSFLE